MYTTYAMYGDARVKLTWVPSREQPEPQESVTSVHGFCFYEGKVVLVDLKRGLDIPGGHMEPGESPEDCFRREALEEAYVRGGACTPIGYLIVDHSENPTWQPGGKYPKVGYQAFYRMDVTELLPFTAEYESASRVIVAPAEIQRHMPTWNELRERTLEAALAAQ